MTLHKTPLTVQQWLAKVNATLPGWWLEDADHSILRSHMIGMAAVMQALEENLCQHLDETYLTLCGDDTIDVYAAERLVPELGYTGDARNDQVREIRSRMHLEGIRERVSLLLDDPTVNVINGYPTEPCVMIDADYDDNEEDILDWSALTNFFSVIVGQQILSADSYVDRAQYVDRDVFAGSTDHGVSPVTENIKKVVDHYKGSGFLYRIFQRG
jgi:hypothetical protein